jgi:hypothetical protein
MPLGKVISLGFASTCKNVGDGQPGGREGMELSSGRRIRASSNAIGVFGVYTTEPRDRRLY